MRKLLLGLIGLLFAIPGFAACPSGQIEQTYTSATGTVTQNGTPTPTNPIEPVFYQQGNMILRKVGDVADSYDATTGKITRKIGVKIFNGTESLTMFNYDAYIKPDASNVAFLLDSNRTAASNGISNHLEYTRDSIWHKTGVPNKWTLNSGTQLHMNFANDVLGITDYTQETQNSVMRKAKAYLKSQFEAGTPYAFYYVLATPFEEDWNETTYCAPDIKIATTAYNSARFSPVVTELNDTIATIRDVVTNTINQTAAIADLQAIKQTRPNEQCPAGKKCLLVEDNDGTPHWYEIIERYSRLPDGYTELEYINKPDNAYVDTGIKFKSENVRIELVASYVSMAGGMFGAQNASNTNSALLIYSNHLYAGVQGFTSTEVLSGNRALITIVANNGNITLTPASGTAVNYTYTGSIQSENGWHIGGMLSRNTVFANSVGTIGTVKIWDNGSLVLNAIPAQRGDEVGFYDTVQERFLPADSENKFTAGPAVQ